jgi:hypothetical protein
MKIWLSSVDAVPDDPSRSWKIRALMLDNKSLALDALRKWKGNVAAGLSTIITSLRVIAGTRGHCRLSDYAKASSGYPGAWEAIAYGKEARLMFFYSEKENLVICTIGMLKGDNQNKAFRSCLELKELYLNREQ